MEKIEVIVFYVGFGDCIHITLADDTQMLVDTGTIKHSKSIISKLKEKNKRVDYILLTHPHSDHINAINKFLESFEVQGIIWRLNEKQVPASPTNDIISKKIEGFILHSKIPIYDIKVAELDLLFFQRYIDVLYPFSENTKFHSNQNRNSIVFTVNIGNDKLLFMGDATINEERKVINRYNRHLFNVIFIKIGHHGSDTSTSTELLKLLKDRNQKVEIVCSNQESRNRKPPSKLKLEEIKKFGLSTVKTGKFNGDKRHLTFKVELTNGKVKSKLEIENV